MSMRRDVIVVGASAGGVEVLRTLVAGLPSDFAAAVLVVLHVPSSGASALPAILNRAGPLPVRVARPDEPLAPGTVYVASPDHHIAVRDGHIALTRGPRENGHRPAIDVLFRSAARALANRVVAVVLSGTLDDGTAGMAAVAARGGATVVQDLEDALYPDMPRNVLDQVAVDHVVPAADLAGLLVRLCDEDIGDDVTEPAPPLMQLETDFALMTDDSVSDPDGPGRPSGYSCPDCNGVLREIEDGNLMRYRCRVGHAWSSRSLLVEQTTRLDDALWMALRGLEEKAALSRAMGARASEGGSPLTAERFAERAEEATRAAVTIRDLLESHVDSTAD